MVTENNSQINSFSKGMNSDISYMMIPEGQYLRGENIRVTGLNQQGESNVPNGVGEIRPIEGVKSISTKLGAKQILATGSIRDIGVIIYKANVNKNPWRVAVFEKDNPNDVQVIFDSEESTTANKFSIVLHHEIEDLSKLYIADGVNPIKLLLIQKTNNKFNIINKDEVESYPKVIFKPITFEGLVNGSLKSGTVQYSYRLYKKYSISTDASPVTNLIPIINNESFSGYRQGFESNSGVKMSIEIDRKYNFLDSIQIFRIHYQENGQLPIIGIVYDGKIKDLPIQESGQTLKINYEDTNNDMLSTLTLEEFNSMSGLRIVPKIIESKNDYMFAGQIKDVQQDLFDVSKVKGEYSFYNITLIGDASTTYIEGSQNSNEYGNFGGTRPPGSSSGENIDNVGFGGAGNVVGGSRSGVKRAPAAAPKSQNRRVLRHNTTQRSVKFNANTWDYGLSQTILSEFDANTQKVLKECATNPTYANPKVSYYFKSLRRGEKYRFGIVFYDENGNSSGVVHLADVTVPELKENPTFTIGDDYELLVSPIGIKWQITGIPTNAVAYEIVRCRRLEPNIKHITQGVLSTPVRKYKYISNSNELNKEYPFTPTGFVTTQNFGFIWHSQDGYIRPSQGSTTEFNSTYADNFDNKNVFQFISPEVLYLKDSIKDTLDNKEIQLYINKALYQDVGNIYLSGSFGSQTQEDAENYYAAFNNTMLFLGNLSQSMSVWDYNKGQLDSNPKTYKLYIKYWHHALQFYKIRGRGDKFRTEWERTPFNGYPFNFMLPTSKTLSIQDSSQIQNTSNESINEVKKSAFSYIKLYNQIDIAGNFNKLETQSKTTPITKDNIKNSTSIVSFGIPNELGWDDMWKRDKDGESYTNKYEDFVSTVGSSLYNNVVIGGFYGEDIKEYINQNGNKYDLANDDGLFAAAGGRCLVIETEDELPKLIPNVSAYQKHPTFMHTLLCDIVKNAQDYGDKKLSTYYSYGAYFTKDNNWSNNSAECMTFIGDTFINPMEYVSMHKIYFPAATNTVSSHCVIYSIPLESSINVNYTHGKEFSKNYTTNVNITNLQIEPSNVYNIYAQTEPLYAYNTAYSINTSARLFAPRDDDDSNAQRNIDVRVHNSNLKLNGEYIDNWLKYQPTNYIDVDSKYGEITHLRTFHNKLIFWQKQAMGLLSVNERTQITDDSNLPLILGTGGVLDRYDYLDNTSGMRKEQYCDTMSDKFLYWYDDDNNELKSYGEGSGIQWLNKALGTQNMMHEYDDDNLPWLFYDNKYDEVVLDLSSDPKWSIVYNESIRAFTSLYNIGFDGAVSFGDKIYLINVKED